MKRWIAGFFGLLASGSAGAATTETIEAFHDAVELGDIPKVEQMIATDPALASSIGEYGFQPVTLMAPYFEPKILVLLLNNGADINSKTEDGITLLHIISEPMAVQFIVAQGGDINALDKDGRTPLIVQSMEAERADVIEALLKAGAKVDVRDRFGKSALDYAREGEEADTITVLTRAGAQ